MIWWRIVLTTLAGFLLGWAVWLAARYLVARRALVAETPRAAGRVAPVAWVPVLAMALWGGYVGWRWPGLAAGTCALLVTALLLCITLVDLRVRRIPNELVLALFGCIVLQLVWLGHPTLGSAALGVAVALGVFGLFYLLGRGAMGLGDVKLEAALGALLGYPAVLAAMFAGVLAGGLAAAFLLLTRRAGRKDSLAYGPYLALGAWLVYTRVLGLWPA